ncbi:Arginine N-methyltransferase 2 [Tulasnella sp. 418]|nr:Arginine N-methyltransferase 2 [Tulasnella sp. 418]
MIEFLLRLIGNRAEAESAAVLKAEAAPAVSSDAFLSTKLRYTIDENGQEICLVDAGDGEDVGVMMGWERPIMQKTVERLCEGQTDEIYVLNVGFGLGIIDGLFQSLHSPPKKHVIIEAHPDVLAHMRSTGWYDKPGVEILEGKWQDFISSPQLLEFGGFDVVYTDTFSEEYDDLHRFFETVPDLLRGHKSRFGWFNGLGATNALFYDVYSRLAEIHIQDIGMNISWSDVEVHGEEEEIWSGTRKYFSLPYYRLPVCEMKP